MGIGKTLSDLLNEKGTNPNELAERIGVSPSTIYSIIKRDNMKVDITILARICKELNVNMETFYSEYISNMPTKSKPAHYSVSDKIRYYRNQAGLSVEELAKASGISASRLKRYESGITLPNNLNEIHQLAKILNIDPIMLLPNDDALSQKAADFGSFGIMQPKSEENHYKNILLSNYNALNEQGKKKLIDYSDDLVGNIKYTEKQTK